MENYTGGGNEIKLYICARQKTEVTVSIPLKGFSNKFTILKDTVIEISLPLADGHTTTHEVVDLTGVHIESDFPVSVSAMNLRGATTDATVVLPLKNIPINPRYVTGHPGFRGFSGLATNEFLIVSPEDRVEIEIVPTLQPYQQNQPIHLLRLPSIKVKPIRFNHPDYWMVQL